jgi:hypothetical protein
MSQSRRQRRQMAKQFGLLGKNESFDQMRERIRRAQKMGQQFHLKNLEDVRNNQIEAQKSREIDSQERLAREILENGEIGIEENLELNSGSFDFLKELKEGPQASDETETENNA